MYVAVASKNPNKLRAAEDAYKILGIPARVVAVEKPPSLPQQPVGLGQVVGGAVARAKAALEAFRQAEHGVGIEAGAVEALGAHLDVTVAAVADRSGEVTIGFGPGFQIPTAFLGEVLKGAELGVAAERFFSKPSIGYREGLIGALTRGRVRRYDLNLAAVLMALVPRLPYNAELYKLRG
ncbi:MAG: DUF84 family protein [Pyrobaculum sp.]